MENLVLHDLDRRSRTPASCGQVRPAVSMSRRGASLFAGHSTRTPSSGQFHWPRCPRRNRLPSGDDPHALSSLGVVADEWEVAAELDHTGQLAAFMKGAADRFG